MRSSKIREYINLEVAHQVRIEASRLNREAGEAATLVWERAQRIAESARNHHCVVTPVLPEDYIARCQRFLRGEPIPWPDADLEADLESIRVGVKTLAAVTKIPDIRRPLEAATRFSVAPSRREWQEFEQPVWGEILEGETIVRSGLVQSVRSEQPLPVSWLPIDAWQLPGAPFQWFVKFADESSLVRMVTPGQELTLRVVVK